MKRRMMALMVGLLLFLVLPGYAAPEDEEQANLRAQFDHAIQEYKSAQTPGEQLAKLHALSGDFGSILEDGEWETDLDSLIAGDLPEGYIPETEGAEEVDRLPESIRNGRFAVVYYRQKKWYWLGHFYTLLPENMRAESLEEADAILYVKHYLTGRDDYIGAANDRHYEIYAIDRSDGSTYLLYKAVTNPPLSGTGTLYGDEISLENIWNQIRGYFLYTFTEEYPEGKAVYEITGNACCLSGLDGSFIRFQLPAEVNGYPVTAVSGLENESLEELKLPEGIAEIRMVNCPKLQIMNFPSTLKQISGLDNTGLKNLDFNEGLETIHGNVSVWPKSLVLPSTLHTVDKYFFQAGTHMPNLVIPGSMESLPDWCFYRTRKMLAIYLPESLQYIGGNDFAGTGCTRIYAPKDSYALKWIYFEGRYNSSISNEWRECESPEEMPQGFYCSEGPFEFGVLDGEAFLLKYTADDTNVIIPDSVNGYPVTEIDTDAFAGKNVESVYVPDSVLKIQGDAFAGCSSLKILDVPGHLIFTSDHHPGRYDDCEVQYRETEQPEIDFSGAQVGDIIQFGHYEQDAHTSNGSEPIDWIVLERTDDSVMVISRFDLECIEYNEKYDQVSWAECTLRTWLNDVFLEEAFSKKEKAMIQTVNTGTAGSDSGADVMDQVFLLNEEEVTRYFPEEQDRMVMITEDAWMRYQGWEWPKSIGWRQWYKGEKCEWWLRTENEGTFANVVSADGTIDSRSVNDRVRIGVRPVMVLRFRPKD